MTEIDQVLLDTMLVSFLEDRARFERTMRAFDAEDKRRCRRDVAAVITDIPIREARTNADWKRRLQTPKDVEQDIDTLMLEQHKIDQVATRTLYASNKPVKPCKSSRIKYLRIDASLDLESMVGESFYHLWPKRRDGGVDRVVFRRDPDERADGSSSFVFELIQIKMGGGRGDGVASNTSIRGPDAIGPFSCKTIKEKLVDCGVRLVAFASAAFPEIHFGYTLTLYTTLYIAHGVMCYMRENQVAVFDRQEIWAMWPAAYREYIDAKRTESTLDWLRLDHYRRASDNDSIDGSATVQRHRTTGRRPSSSSRPPPPRVVRS